MTVSNPLLSSRRQPGGVVLITGLPASGKTTLASTLTSIIENDFDRRVTLLDGDEVRRLLSSELGFSREHRRMNVLRHGYLAAEICKHGGIAICALIAPYDIDRADMRRLVTQHGDFIEVYLSTPLAECERRDPKKLYARARAGIITHMTGIDDPYEPPQNPELQFDGQLFSVENMAHTIIQYMADHHIVCE